MPSFLKNLKSTLLDPPSQKKMPSRNRPNEDPFKRINSWDDGYEYIRKGDRSMDGTPGPMYSPPLTTSSGVPPPKPTRRSTYEPDYDYMRDSHHRHAYPSPPESDVDTPRKHRRKAARSPSPPLRRRDSRRDGGVRYRDDDAAPRPHLDSRFTAPPRTRDRDRDRDMRSGRDRDSHSPRSNSRSPSPRPRRPADRRHHHSHRSPSPHRNKGTRYRDYPDHDRDRDRDTNHTRPNNPRRPTNTTRHRSPSPPSFGTSPSSSKKYPPRAGATHTNRPPISRSKTTSSAGTTGKGGNLSPRWQKAAQAALQAGSVAAFQMRSQPGGWKGEKGARVATAALGAAAMDVFLKGNGKEGGEKGREKERERDGGRDGGGGGGGGGGGSRRKSEVEMLGDAVGGFLADQFSKRSAGGRR